MVSVDFDIRGYTRKCVEIMLGQIGRQEIAVQAVFGGEVIGGLKSLQKKEGKVQTNFQTIFYIDERGKHRGSKHKTNKEQNGVEAGRDT